MTTTDRATRAVIAPTVDVLAADGATTAVVLVLAGGKADSFDRADSAQLTAVRMRPFAAALHRGGRRHGLAVWTLRYRYRGWNGAERSPVADVQWALDEVRRRHGAVPVVLLGHSMGGGSALAAAGDAAVRGVCALAPWTEADDPVEQLPGASILIAHGTVDLVTSARGSRRFARRAATVAARIGYVKVRGDTHAMLFRWRRWHRLATGFTFGVLDIAAMPRAVTRAFDRGV